MTSSVTRTLIDVARLPTIYQSRYRRTSDLPAALRTIGWLSSILALGYRGKHCGSNATNFLHKTLAERRLPGGRHPCGTHSHLVDLHCPTKGYGAQWPMILSGAQSTWTGVMFWQQSQAAEMPPVRHRPVRCRRRVLLPDLRGMADDQRCPSPPSMSACRSALIFQSGSATILLPAVPIACGSP